MNKPVKAKKGTLTNFEKNISFGKLILLFAFLEGAGVMTVEMAASRFIAPMYGSSFTVWVIVLCSMIVGLASGYYFGGIQSKKNNQHTIAVYNLLFSGFFIVVSPLLANYLILDFNTDHFIVSIFISSLLFVCVPMFTLGTLSTLLVHIATEENKENAGTSAGKIYGISTIGGILFALLTGYFFIPYLGLKLMCFIIGFVTILLCGLYIIKTNKKQFFYAVVVLSLVIMILNLKAVKQNASSKIVHNEEGLMGQLLVIDKQNNTNGVINEDRILYVNRMGQTWINKSTGDTRWSYVNYLLSICSLKPDKSDVLLLGLGGGTVANYLTKYTQAKVDAVEFDERIISIAKKYFALNSEANVIADDARHYINACNKKYDIIIFDVFKGEVPPHYVLSKESLKKVKNILKPNGFIVINFNGFINGEAGYPVRCVYATLQDAGLAVHMLPTPEPENDRNILFVAANTPVDMSNARIKVTIAGKEAQLTELVLNKNTIDLKNVQIITDDRPFLELINLEAANSWRKSYYEYHTKEYTKQGIPLFF